MAGPTRSTIAFAIRGPVGRSQIPGLCDRALRLIEPGMTLLAVCDVGAMPADAVSVDTLARLRLGAGRRGCRLRVRNASPELCELIELMGLDQALGGAPSTGG